ncbi:caspase domain-containing protein [Desarmillaria tabescens]|uniref:Caspase domain-containing protein n=1 Tax=Armillaria tabescens TaxID=1929756 RepID=A0AA39IZD1_ARMTA|nr:caspase domain-containing protein [Desarmillaria tabescens]KAK0433300.1 caspase domain-containing protein [Desarmillaria tabescens]
MVSNGHPSQATLRRLACKSNYAPVPLTDPELQEIRPLTDVEERLAQKFGMASPEDIDSVAVLQEARRHSKLPRRQFRSALLTFLRKVSTSASDDDDEKKLHRLYHLRLKDASNPRQLSSVRCESPTLTRGAQFHIDASRFWAVLIGIDAYDSNPLHGCVPDALLMKKLLLENIGVPEHRIQCLLGTRKPSHGDPLTPSRANIVNMLHSLINNPEIEWGDNIIIYYAGHGSSYHCSEHFSTSLESQCSSSNDICPIEALCPIDRDTIDADGRPIPDISDRELNALFSQISRAKGHKITFIADCCHAGGMSRDPDPEAGLRFTRATLRSNVDDMLRAADEILPHHRSVLSKNWFPDMSSHVVLAACRDYQYAKETLEKDGYGGVFTKTLVSVLKSNNWEEMTYVGLAERLNRDYFQTPVVAGDHKYEHLWYQA